MELVLGTVQFGLAYGAVGSGRMVEPETARQLLDAAWQQGVRRLDTAAAYGDIEARLSALCGAHAFRIVSKITGLGSIAAAERPAALRESIARSIERLGAHLDTLLFHSAADLLAPDGAALWEQAVQALAGRAIRLGVSVYAPAELVALRKRFDIEVAQLPGNALDQRLTADGVAQALQGVELHLRSAFLQGLLLAPARAAQRVPAAAAALQRWQLRCAAAGLDPSVAALGVVKGLPGVQCCVVGVETTEQFHQIARAWERATPLLWPELAVDDPAVFDPRQWPPA